MFGFIKSKKQQNQFRKHTSVYVSDKYKHLIVTRKHINADGIMYEQEQCFTADYPMDFSALGEEVVKSLNLFAVKESDLTQAKLSDWPAYKHSKCKSIPAFNTDYII